MGRRRRAAAAGMALALLAVASGCTSSSGLLFRPGPHQLLPSAQRVGQAARGPLQLPREMDKQVLAEYRVEPGDVLLIEPADPGAAIRLPGDQPVLPDGRIDLGGYGRLEVAGMTVDQIQAEVEALVGRQAKKRQPISVRLVDPESHVYYVLGEVNSPGAYPLKGRETVLDTTHDTAAAPARHPDAVAAAGLSAAKKAKESSHVQEATPRGRGTAWYAPHRQHGPGTEDPADPVRPGLRPRPAGP